MNENHDPKTGEFTSGSSGGAIFGARILKNMSASEKAFRDTLAEDPEDAKPLQKAHDRLDKITAAAHTAAGDIVSRHPELDKAFFDRVKRGQSYHRQAQQQNPVYKR